MGGYTLEQLAAAVGARLEGDPNLIIRGVGTLAAAGADQIAFLSNRKYRRQLPATRAGAVVLDEGSLIDCPTAALVADNPYAAYAGISALFEPRAQERGGRHDTAVVHPTAEVEASAWIGPHAVIGPRTRVGARTVIGPNCSVEADCILGDDVRLVANVVVYHGCRLGHRVLVHAGAVIGSDGFGFASDGGEWRKVYQLGAALIGDDVEIGANTTIDRGAIDDTVIEEGVKLDNLIQIAHNVRIGAHSALAGCVGVAGSAEIGRHCAIGGGVGILGHLTLADHVTVTPMSLVTKSVTKPGVYSAGVPLEPIEKWQKNFARFKQLDEMARKIKMLEKKFEELKKGRDLE